MKPRSIPTADDTVIRHVQIADGICRFSAVRLGAC